MGYGIVGSRSKKEMFEEDIDLVNIQCSYAYEPYFREAFGCEITNWRGKLCKTNIPKFVEGLDKFISMLENGLSVPMFQGNLANISNDRFIKELKELRQGVLNREIRYLLIG